MANSIKIMIVDDFDLVTVRLTKGLSALKGSKIVGYSDDSMDAIDKYFEIQPDILILDLMLKSGSGFDVLENIKTRPESKIVIVFTYHGNPFIKQSCIDSGADYVLDKSNDFERLITICNDLIIEHLAKPKLQVNNIDERQSNTLSVNSKHKLLSNFFPLYPAILNLMQKRLFKYTAIFLLVKVLLVSLLVVLQG